VYTHLHTHTCRNTHLRWEGREGWREGERQRGREEEKDGEWVWEREGRVKGGRRERWRQGGWKAKNKINNYFGETTKRQRQEKEQQQQHKLLQCPKRLLLIP
jgi:hypothetical protein